MLCLCSPFHRIVSKESCRGRAECEALRQNQPVSWKWRGHLLPSREWSHALPVPVRVRKRVFVLFILFFLIAFVVVLWHLCLCVAVLSLSDAIYFHSILSQVKCVKTLAF